MPLLDSALAFAITMLALSLACSAFVELIHRIFKMRQAGFKYMLEQMFDQVLSKYFEQATKDGTLKAVKSAFVERMRANRVPMGTPNATPADDAAKVKENTSRWIGVWGGRELTELSPVGFMERLGTMDIGTTIKNAAGDLDAALKDIAQKFEALGKDAADYFEGRARLISVVVAVVFAFVVHADAVDLYTTFLRNPSTTASVIAQSEAITKQFAAAQDAAKTADDAKAAADAKKLADGKQPSEDPQRPVTPDDGQKQFEDARDAAKAAKAGAEKMVKQFADLGVPLGWTDQRLEVADPLVLLWSCKEMPAQSWFSWMTVLRTCKQPDEMTGTTAKDANTGTPATATAAKGGTVPEAPKKTAYLQYTNVWLGIPKNLGVLFYLVLGGLLIGLGAPFWYNVVTTITNLRNAAGGAAGAGGAGGAGGATGSAAQAPGGLLALGAPAEADKAQPVTPAGAFQVAQAAKK
jgi:hypothetical protein